MTSSGLMTPSGLFIQTLGSTLQSQRRHYTTIFTGCVNFSWCVKKVVEFPSKYETVKFVWSLSWNLSGLIKRERSEFSHSLLKIHPPLPSSYVLTNSNWLLLTERKKNIYRTITSGEYNIEWETYHCIFWCLSKLCCMWVYVCACKSPACSYRV